MRPSRYITVSSPVPVSRPTSSAESRPIALPMCTAGTLSCPSNPVLPIGPGSCSYVLVYSNRVDVVVRRIKKTEKGDEGSEKCDGKKVCDDGKGKRNLERAHAEFYVHSLSALLLLVKSVGC